jgi:hypothetical protein
MNGYLLTVAGRYSRWYRVGANYEVVPMPAPNSSPFPERRSPELEIIFSSRDGYVWASWPDSDAVKLGPHEVVAAMMRDFLAQDALGKRLGTRCSDDF